MMPTEITLSEYRKLTETLPHIQPFSPCCGHILQDMIYVEPLEGRNTPEVGVTDTLPCCERLMGVVHIPEIFKIMYFLHLIMNFR
jgi:hypothetical protein